MWTNIYTGTAITAFLINTVLLPPSHIGPRLSVQISSYVDKNYNISGLPLGGATTQTGSFADFKLNWTMNLVSSTTTITLILTRTSTRPRTFP